MRMRCGSHQPSRSRRLSPASFTFLNIASIDRRSLALSSQCQRSKRSTTRSRVPSLKTSCSNACGPKAHAQMWMWGICIDEGLLKRPVESLGVE